MLDPVVFSELRTAYETGGLLPFIGAGVSMSVSWSDGSGTERRGPSWRDLVDAAAQQLGYSDPSLLRVRGEDLQILEYFRDKHDGRLAPLTNWLVRELAAPDKVLVDNPILAALATMNLCPTFYTTNFDNFLERGITLNGRPARAVATEGEIRSFLSARTRQPQLCEVVKFHGDLDHPDEMVVTDSDYRRRLKLEATMDDRLRADLLGRVVLFIGYSFRDWNVSYLFHLIEHLRGPLPNSTTGRRAFITVAEPSEFEVALFARRQMGVIPVRSGHAMTADVADFVSKITQGLGAPP